MRNKCVFFEIKPGFYLLCAIILLVFPVKWVCAWLTALIIHELAHFLVLRLFKAEIYKISLGISGIVMNTNPVSCGCEIVASLAGPIAGLLLTFFAKWFPHLAVCAVFQSAFNLLPIYPLDGGRAVLGAMKLIFSEKTAMNVYKWIKWVVLAVITGFLILLSNWGFGLLPICVAVIILIKSSCIGGKKIVK